MQKFVNLDFIQFFKILHIALSVSSMLATKQIFICYKK